MTPDPTRLRGFLLHLAVYFVATVVLVLINMRLAPDSLLVLWPLLAWGVLVALHAARVMGLLPGGRS